MSNSNNDQPLSLKRNELLIINNALNEILHGPDAIDEEEFHSRIGVKKEEALDLAKKIRSELI